MNDPTRSPMEHPRNSLPLHDDGNASNLQRSPLIGQQLGNYRLLQFLAEGGFAEVYLGEHVHLNTYAAIKVLHTRFTKDELEAFHKEARLVARLRHPHIISVLDFAVQDGAPFLVMEYAPKGTLRHRHPRGEVLSAPTILSYLTQVADALSYAHSQRLIHRDIKPENILVGQRDEILLSDFGTAIVLQTSHPDIQHSLVGTVAYMAPELFQGCALPASDQYSLAVVAYEWLCGEKPFQGSITELVAQHINAPPPSLHERNPNISHALEQVVFRALAKNPEQRYPSVHDFVLAFAAACLQQAFLEQETATRKAVPSSLLPFAKTVEASSPTSAIADTPVLQKTSRGRLDAGHFSRRTLLMGAGGVILLGLTTGGIVWFVKTQPFKRFIHDSTPSATPIAMGTLLFTYRSHIDTVNTISWSPDGTYIASGSSDRTVRVWYVQSGADARSYSRHTDNVNAVAWSPDGKYIASASSDRTVQVWTATHEGDPMSTYTGHNDVVNAVTWSPDTHAQYVASGGNDKLVHVWKAADASEMAIYDKHSDIVRATAWSPDGKYIASASADHTVQVWPAPQAGDTPKDPTNSGITPIVTFTGHSDTVNTVAWSPDGKYIASGSDDKTVQIWYSVTGGNPLVVHQQHTDTVNAVAWSSNGNLIASASNDGTVRIWQPANGTKVYTYQGHSSNGTVNAVYSVMWSPGDLYVASAGADKTVQLWYG